MQLKELIIFVLALLMASPALAGSVHIEKPDNAQLEIIQAALGHEYPISKAAATRSLNHGKAYYVGAVFHATGAGDLTGVWFVKGGKEKPKAVFALDGNAYHFSGIAKASETQSNVSKADPEARAIKKYLEQ